MAKYPKEFLDLCLSITDKRPKTVIEHILKHGYITTSELKTKYGYNHPPRAARDVREKGIPLETFRVVGPDGRKIAAYRFSNVSTSQFRRLDGRTGLSKELKDKLIEKYGCRCFIYLEEVNYRDLQIDHRIPYEVAGEAITLNSEDFMLLCAQAQLGQSTKRMLFLSLCRLLGQDHTGILLVASLLSSEKKSFTSPPIGVFQGVL